MQPTHPSRRARALFASTGLALLLAAAPAAAQGTSGLSGDTAVLCLATGGTLNLTLNAGAANAGNVYLLLGSASGTTPGFPIQGNKVPLNVPDPYFDFTLANAGNAALFPGTIGLLDGAGKGSAGVVLPVGLNPALAGIRLDYAYLVAKVVPNNIKIPFTSNSVPLTLELAPVAGFGASSPTSGAAPLQVTFVNTTQNAASSFLWTFGDGTTSTASQPVKTYTSSGSFTVTLKATGPCGTSSVTKPGFVQVAKTFGEVYPILSSGKCLGCHQGAFPGGGLPFDTKNAAFAALVNVKAACTASETRVIPGNASGSFLVKKVREATFGTPNACGLPMPFSGLPASALSASQIADIESWIGSGAPNN